MLPLPKNRLNMLNRLLRQQLLPPLPVSPHASLQRRPHDIIEQKSPVDKQGEAEDLQRLERLPAQSEGDDPDEEGAAGVDCGAGGGADGARYGEAEEIETAVLRGSQSVRWGMWDGGW